jgi:transposase
MQPLRACIVDPYIEFIRDTLERHPRLRATRIYAMVRDRGYTGSVVQLRRAVGRLRPQIREPFLQLHAFPGEQAQADWAHFGYVMVGRTKRALSCFVVTLSYSRALSLEFFFDQTMENFLRGHVHAFEAWRGQPRVILYDNLKSAVLERRGNQILFHPRLELSAHYHFAPRPCQVRAGNQKGRVERAIRYVRDSFWAGRAAPSPRWPNAIARLCSGAIKSRISAAGPEGTTAPLPMCSPKSSLACCLPLYIRSPPIASRRRVRARPFMCASILTITRSRRKRSAGR